MTYSRMAFCGRPPAVPEAASKKIRGQRVLGVRAQPQRTSSSSIAGAALVRALSVAPFLDDEVEVDGARRKKAAGRRLAARPARGSSLTAVTVRLWLGAEHGIACSQHRTLFQW